jgi:hypothetical protein
VAGIRLAVWRKLQQLPTAVQDALHVAPYVAIYSCIWSLTGDGEYPAWVPGLAAGATIWLYEHFRDDGRIRSRVREARRTGVSSGYPLIDATALDQLPEPRTGKFRSTGASVVVGLLLVIALPVAASIVRTPWWLLAIPLAALVLVWDADAPERRRRLREALAASAQPSSILTTGDGSPPRPAQPAV